MMQMYSNEVVDDARTTENDKHEKRKKKHRKTREGNYNDTDVVNGSKSAEFQNGVPVTKLQRRRSEEENYEPSNEIRRKHRHRRSKTEDNCQEVPQINGVVKEEDNSKTLEEQEEARRQRREKKRRARERRKPHNEPNNNLQSPLSEPNEYDITGSYNSELEAQINELEPELMLHDEVEQPPPNQTQPKKKKGGFARIFASLKKKGKSSKHGGQANDEVQSNPDLFNPVGDSQTGTLQKIQKKIRGKSARDLLFRKAHVILLDGEEIEIEVDLKATGSILFMRVCDELELLEKDFFGITFVNSKLQTWFWLDMDKKISKQLGKDDEWTFNFQVKFYPPEPLQLQEDLTRYLLSLQVRQDVYTGKLPCSWITQALLGSFMVQSELGDYDEIIHNNNIEYLREFEFVLNQSDQLLDKICELHKKHVGMLPERADIKYMETAKRLEQYGVDLHPARDNDDVEIFIGVSYQGILIYRDRVRIGRFAWPKVLRISYKKNYFYLKIRSDRYDDSVAIVGFKLFNHHLAKRLWKNSAEQHTFFRLKEAQIIKNVTRIASNASSSSGYSCKTLHQYRSMNLGRTHPVQFERTISKRRTIGSMPAGLNRTGLQYSSMHSLNRLHPRDMTLGKTKSVEHLCSKQPGSAIGMPYNREGSLGNLSNTRQPSLFRAFGLATKDDDRHHSFRSGDSVNCGESYTVNNDDDQLSLPSISPNVHQELRKPVKKIRSNVSSIDGLSDDGQISSTTKDPPRNNISIKSNKSVPLPLPPDSESSSDCDITDSCQKPALRFQPRQSQYRAPLTMPDPIPEPPSTSSSVRSSPTGQYMPPPPPSVDLQLMYENSTDNHPGTSSKPKPVVKPKPIFVVKHRGVVSKSSPGRGDDHHML